MDDIIYSASMAFARFRFEQLANLLREKMKGMSPSGNHEGVTDLYQEFRRDFDRGCTEWARGAWSMTLFDLLRPILAAVPLPEMRLLYLATDNGGMEFAAADDVEDVFPGPPWIEEEIIQRASELHSPAISAPVGTATLSAGMTLA